jgi:LysR family transcriptional regulator, transcriptional activator of nhaA
MRQLNYKHLRYFWSVAKTGSIVRASEQLHLTPQSISGQLTEFERSLEVELFRRVGRRLILSEAGHRIFRYADEIFALGTELMDAVKDGSQAQRPAFRLGIADSVPKSVTYRVTEPVLTLEQPVRLICREGRLNALLGELALHRLDLVLADQPMPTALNVRAYNHLIGRSPLTVFGAPTLAKTLIGDFPAMLHDAPFLLPGDEVALRPRLMQWFTDKHVRPLIVGEFDDSALIKDFALAGAGLFVAPSAIAPDLTARGELIALGEIDTVSEELYAITSERHLTHPAIVAIVDSTRMNVFG